jgi:hypothetical protein
MAWKSQGMYIAETGSRIKIRMTTIMSGFWLRMCTVMAILGTLVSCGNDDETPGEVVVQGVISAVIRVNSGAQGEDVTFSSGTRVDLIGNPEFAPYSGNLLAVEVTALDFAIINYTAPAGPAIYISLGDITFGPPPGSQSAAASCTLNFLPVTDWSGTDPFELLECDAIKGEIAAILLQHEATQVTLGGTLTRAPVAFDMTIRIDVKIRAQATS